MKKKVALKGDKTTTDGTILAGGRNASLNHRPVARKGDPVYCPKCNTTGVIVEGTNQYLVDNIPVALDGYLVACECSSGSNRIIAVQGQMWVDA